MEIVLNDACYSSKVMNQLLNNVTYTFSSGISFIYGIEAKILKELLFQEKKLNKGSIYLSERGYMFDVAYLSDVDCNSFHEDNIYDEMIYYANYYGIKYSDTNKRIKDSLKIVNLKISNLNIPFSELSNNDLRKMKLAVALFLNAKIFILDNFEKGLSYKEIDYYRKLCSKLNKVYHKSILVFSNDLSSYLDIVDDIVIFKNGKIVYNGDKNSLYDSKLYNYIDQPSIIHYVNYLKDKGHIFDNYTDMKELLKAIYRDVENK